MDALSTGFECNCMSDTQPNNAKSPWQQILLCNALITSTQANQNDTFLNGTIASLHVIIFSSG